MKKEYEKEELVITWEHKKCIHAAKCVGGLPNVFKPNERPWIQPESASVDELKAQIDQCPSGALGYYMKGEEPAEEAGGAVTAQVFENGPVIVVGNIILTDKDGSTDTLDRAAFCRCGASKNKPFCDGSHKEVGFEG